MNTPFKHLLLFNLMLTPMLTSSQLNAAHSGTETTFEVKQDGNPEFLHAISQTRSFVTENSDHEPEVMGVRFLASMLQNLPAFPGRRDNTQIENCNPPGCFETLEKCNEYPCERQNVDDVCPSLSYLNECLEEGFGRNDENGTVTYTTPSGQSVDLIQDPPPFSYTNPAAAGFSDETLCHPPSGPGRTCAGGYRAFLDLKENADKNPEQIFEVMQFAWNPTGYGAGTEETVTIYDSSLIGVHFYLTDQTEIDSIESGDGPNLLSQTSFERVSKRVPNEFLPAVDPNDPRDAYLQSFEVPRMGRHVVSSRNFADAERAAHNLVYGSNDGKIIFFEPIIFRPFLDRLLHCHNFPFANFGQIDLVAENRPDPNKDEDEDEGNDNIEPVQCPAKRTCIDIDRLQNVRKTGHYPQEYCITYDDSTPANPEIIVTLESFEFRRAFGMETTTKNSASSVSLSSTALYALVLYGLFSNLSGF